MSLFAINNSVTKPNTQNIYYNLNNKIYYNSKYVKNYIQTLSLFDGVHEDNSYGYDLSTNKRLFSNNKSYRITYYG